MNGKISYQQHLPQCINLLSDPTLIMMIFFMINHICLFTKRWNPFSIMPVLAITVAIQGISKEKIFQELD